MKKRQHNQNTHHLLWCRRLWGKGWNRTLRNHPYCQVLIPAETLHKRIHTELTYIPTPDGVDSKRVLDLLAWLDACHALDYDDDILTRLEFLIEAFSSPQTVEALKRQYEIVATFYTEVEN